MLSRDVDFCRRGDRWRWLGRHRLASMYQRSKGRDVLQLSRTRVIPAGVAADADIVARYTSFPEPVLRFHLSDPSNPATGRRFHAELPFDITRTSPWPLSEGFRVPPGIENPYGSAAGATINKNLIESRVFAMQNFFLGNRLVTSFGVRGDRTRQASLPLARRTASPTAAFPSVFEFDPPTNCSVHRRGTTRTIGAVAHVLPWFSIFYNASSTWNSPTVFVNPVGGSRYPGSIGDGQDFGVMVRAFGERLSLRLNRYRNTSGPAISVAFRNGILPVVRNIERTLNQAVNDGRIASRPPTPFYDPEVEQYIQDTLTSDRVSTEHEFELTFNPTRNLRLALNGAQADVTESNVGRDWFEFIRLQAPLWEANRELLGPDTQTTAIGMRYLALIQQLNLTVQADGQKVEQGREWRGNLVTLYSIPEGRLRGAFVGGGYCWRSSKCWDIAQRSPKTPSSSRALRRRCRFLHSPIRSRTSRSPRSRHSSAMLGASGTSSSGADRSTCATSSTIATRSDSAPTPSPARRRSTPCRSRAASFSRTPSVSDVARFNPTFECIPIMASMPASQSSRRHFLEVSGLVAGNATTRPHCGQDAPSRPLAYAAFVRSARERIRAVAGPAERCVSLLPCLMLCEAVYRGAIVTRKDLGA